jgi:hypothetical protein
MKKILLLLSTVVVFASCNKQYKDLGEGLFAEFDTNMGTMIVKI